MKPWNKKLKKIAIALKLLLLVSQPLWSAVEMNSWLSYQIRHENDFDLFGNKFTSICVFAYDFDTNDKLRPAQPWVDQELNTLMARPHQGRPVFITIVNDIESNPPSQHDGALVLRILSDPVKRAAHIQQIVQLSARADGIDIDYEGLLTGTRPYYSQFMKELRAALPNGKLLAAVCQPKTDDADGPRGQAIDWVAVGPNVDIMKVMTYYYSFGASPPGPAAPLDKVHDVTALAVSEIPASKLQIVLTQFGWDWPNGSNGSFIEYNEAIQLAKNFGVTPFRDSTSQYLRINYTDSGGTPHQVWFPDKTTLLAQINIIQNQLNVNKVDIWQMGVGDPAFWIWARDNTTNPNQHNPTPGLVTINPRSLVAGSAAFTLTATGNDFIFDSVLRWNGKDRPTTFVNYQTVTATITANEIAEVGTSNVTVFSEGPGGGTSQTVLFFSRAPGSAAPPLGVPAENLSSVRVYPNPMVRDKNASNLVTFDNLTPDATVKIFTISAQWVKSLPANQGFAIWDLTNDSSEKVASGYYLYLVTDPDGRSTKGKLAVIK